MNTECLEWNGWWCCVGKHIITDPNIQMSFVNLGDGLTGGVCPDHQEPCDTSERTDHA